MRLLWAHGTVLGWGGCSVRAWAAWSGEEHSLRRCGVLELEGMRHLRRHHKVSLAMLNEALDLEGQVLGHVGSGVNTAAI